MHADRYVQPSRFNPAGLAAAVGINAAVVAALIFAAPHVLPGTHEPDLKTYTVPIDEPPPPAEDKPLTLLPNRPVETIDVPKTVIETPRTADLGETTTLTQPVTGPVIGTDFGSAAVEPSSPPPLPYVEASVDPRYAADLQPAYPASERRAEREGRVTIRVLIGADGRVRQAEQVSATSDAFWRATLDQAMRRWRFKAATRGGVPVEAWRTMTLRFVLDQG